MAIYTNKSHTATVYANKLGKGDAWTYDQEDITYDQIDLSYDYWTDPTVYTNTSFNNLDTDQYDLSIGSGFKINIGSGFNLIIQPENKVYTNKSKQVSNYTNKNFAAVSTTEQHLNIGSGFNINIGSGFKLKIQSSSTGNIYTNKPINN